MMTMTAEAPVGNSKKDTAISADLVLDTLIGSILLVCCILTFTSNVWRTLQSSDTAWLIKTGEYILSHGLPRQDIFSQTAGQHGWILYQWLFECLAAIIYGTGGLQAVAMGTSVAAAMLFFYILPAQMIRYRIRLPYIFGLLLLIFDPGWFWARPQIVSFVLIPIFVNILEESRSHGFSNKTWCLPALIALWANMHSFWFIGILIILAYVVDALAGKKFELRICNQYIALAATSITAVLINPYGWKLFTYNLSFLTEPDFSALWELKPLLLLDPAGHAAILTYFAIAGTLLVTGRRAVPLSGLILAGLSMTAALFVYRFVPVSVLLTWPYAAMALAQFAPFQLQPFKITHKRMAKLSAAFIALGTGVLASVTTFAPGQMIWFTHANNNHKAIEYLKLHPDLRRNMFCDGAFGCSQIWEGLTPVFIDTRFDLYGKDFCDQFVECLYAEPSWRDHFARWNIATVAISANYPLNRALMLSGKWTKVFDDSQVLIWKAKPAVK